MATLAYGSQNMRLRKVERQIGQQIKQKQVIDCTESDCAFKIGHSIQDYSETFIPSVYYDDNFGITFVDLPELDNYEDNFIGIVNDLVVRYLLKSAARVRILLSLTEE